MYVGEANLQLLNAIASIGFYTCGGDWASSKLSIGCRLWDSLSHMRKADADVFVQRLNEAIEPVLKDTCKKYFERVVAEMNEARTKLFGEDA